MNTSLPSLDVVVLCYNEEREIAACLDALLVQADEIQRIIVVNNNSTDTSGEILNQYRVQYPNKVFPVIEYTQGIVPARNRGLAESTAEIVARIDADTRVSGGWAKAIRAFYAAHPDIAAGTGAVEYYDLPGRQVARFFTWLFVHVVNKASGGSIDLYGANMSLRRTAWENIKDDMRMDANIMEDLAIGIALGNKQYRTASIPAAFAKVSGRRMRTSPRQFAKYNMQWPRTYAVYGKHAQAVFTHIVACIGIVLQIPAAYILQYHDPKTGKFGLRKVARYEERVIP